jgi:hypothetical protein
VIASADDRNPAQIGTSLTKNQRDTLLAGLRGDNVDLPKPGSANSAPAHAPEHAERHLCTLTTSQEGATKFPICKDEAAFQKFTSSTVKGIKIADVYGPNGITALASVQPFSFEAEAAALGIARSRTAQDDLEGHAPYVLDVLWNGDKHRRLLGLAWLYRMMACTGQPGACHPAALDYSVPVDGQILARHHFRTAEDVHPVSHMWYVDLALADGPSTFPAPLIETLEDWQRQLGGWVIPRMFLTAQTGGPPRS